MVLLRIPEDVVCRELGGETVVLKLMTGSCFSLNEVGTRIWAGVRKGQTPAEVAEGIAAEWEVELDVAQGDVKVFIDECLARGLLLETFESPKAS